MKSAKKKPTAAKLQSWRVSIMRARAQGLGTVAASDRQSPEAEAVRAFGRTEDQRKRLFERQRRRAVRRSPLPGRGRSRKSRPPISRTRSMRRVSRECGYGESVLTTGRAMISGRARCSSIPTAKAAPLAGRVGRE
jgi:hypothetical protein